MTAEQKPKIANFDRKDAEELTPEQAEEAQGGGAVINSRHPLATRAGGEVISSDAF